MNHVRIPRGEVTLAPLGRPARSPGGIRAHGRTSQLTHTPRGDWHVARSPRLQGLLTSCAWIATEGLSGHPHGDSWLAVAGTDAVVQVISVAEARVVCELDAGALTGEAGGRHVEPD